MAATVVLVHGAWHGAWCWELVTPKLDAAGVASIAVDLPSVNRPGATLADDADHVRSVLDTVDGPALLVAHSYGGAVATDAGTHPAVEKLVFITAFVLLEGESVMANDLSGGESMTLAERLVFTDDTVSVDPAHAVADFYHDCDAALAASAVAQLRPTSIAAMSGIPRAVAWRDKPSTYVVCTDDRALPEPFQRSNAKRIATSVDIPTSHSPFLSHPGLIADLLVELSR